MREKRTYGKPTNFTIYKYSQCKYTANQQIFDNAVKEVLKDVEYWEIVTGDDAKQIKSQTGLYDDCNEYLVIHMAGGNTATFRNSYCDMFRI